MSKDNFDDPAFKPMDRPAMARQDAHFADDYVLLPGAAMPISKTLARQLMYEIDRVPFTAGADQAEDGDLDDGPSQQGGR